MAIPKKHTIDDLNRLYETAKSMDREAVAEMRSNILLIAGEHYTKKMSAWENSRSRVNGPSPTESQKLRITKNRIHRSHRLYVSSIMSQSPDTTVMPNRPTELADKKQAELNESVWLYLKKKYKLKAAYRDWASDFTGIGECCCIVKFDPTKGRHKGYEQAVDELGNPAFDEMGNPLPDETKPVMSGDFVFKRVFPQNIFRDPSCQQMKDALWVGFETVESCISLKAKYEGQPDKQKMIEESSEEYVVFDSARNGYGKEKDQVVLREFYYKPCDTYKNGYFFITTKAGILEEGELPFGIWPLAWKGFDEHATKPRATSMVKVARPYQAELNRASSQAAMHQITVGDDKIMYQAGTKISQGASIPGIRGLTYQGAEPIVIQGRSGDQFFEYIDRQSIEMDDALLLDVLNNEKMTNLDPMAMLFRSMNQTQKFSIYSTKFGEFLMEITEIALELAKHYLDDDEYIGAVGKAEWINIAEFRSTVPLHYQITIQEQEDTIETKLGKQLVLNHVLQYVGNNLSREDIGKLVMNMPFGNWEDSFSDFTIDSKNVQNDFLAIERGEEPYISEKDNSEYILRQVAKRKKERDYNLLSEQVRMMYDMYEQYHEQKIAQEAAAAKQAQSEFIPTGGAMIACDMYVAQEDPNKAPKRVRVPYQALEHLLQLLEQQGMTLDKLESMNSAQLAEISQQFMSGGGQQALPAGA